MKQIKKLLFALTAFVLCIVPILSTPITAHAEGEPVTYYLKYMEDSKEWRFQTGTWQKEGYDRELYYLHQNIKNGDSIAVDGNTDLRLEVNVHLKDLTIINGNCAVVTANGIDNVYTINNSISAINGDVTNAFVYDDSVCNFNNNVSNLEIVSSRSDLLKSTVVVVGTVGHVKAYGTSNTHFDLYNFEAGSLLVEEGNLKTEAGKYSNAPSAVATTPEPVAPAPAPAAPAPEAVAPAPAPAAPAPETVAPAPVVGADEYDEVPKTADIRFQPLWLVCMAVICLTGSFILKREK